MTAMNRFRCVIVLVSSVVVCACSAPIDAGDQGKTGTESSTPAASPSAPLVGGDRDAHGCIASAGYQWCEHTGRCERSWELARQEGFRLDEEGFKVFCSAPRGP